MYHYAWICLTTPKQTVLFYRSLSGWANTMGKMLGPKIVNGIKFFAKDIGICYHNGRKSNVCNL